MSTILLCTMGSAGDVHPFLAMGAALRRLGHRPVIVTSAFFEESCANLGLEFEELLPATAFDRARKDPDIWHPWRGFGVLARDVIVPAMRPLYERIAAWHAREEDLVVAASLLCVGARVAQDALGVPLASVHVQPVVLRSFQDPLHTPHFSYPRTRPQWQRALTYRIADRLIIDRALKPALDDLRADLGLPSVSRVFDQWVHSPDLVLGLWPSWFAPVQPDWPDNVELTGFPLYDPGEHDPLPAAVAAFLERGDPPVVFTAGSANLHTEELFTIAGQVCRTLGIRGLLVGPQPPAHAPVDGRRLLHTGFVPFASLLPHCRAIVHHGGIGTTARAILHRLPQVVLPHSHDQPENAMRVRELGFGEFIPVGRLDERRLTAALERQLHRRVPRTPSPDVGTRLGPDVAAEAITRIARTVRV